MAKPTKKRICVADTETDPFEYGCRIAPFTLGFYDGECYYDFWGDDCVEQFFEFLASYDEELLIYCHYGGGLDFLFFLQHVDEIISPTIIHGKIASIYLKGQEFRDSFRIIPTSLASYQKDEIDYQKFVKSEREKHKKEILSYQKSDCLYLYDLVFNYQNTFGDSLTIGGTAIRLLSEFTKWDKLTPTQDKLIRSYYYGGRCQCFKSGLLYGDFKVYDVNSMYPNVMKRFLHPVSNNFWNGKRILKNTAFVCFEGYNYGALPIRSDDNSLNFTTEYGVFFVSVHEFIAGEETGTIKCERVIKTVNFDTFKNFEEFVDHYYGLRLVAKANLDKIFELFYKLLLNNAYGKFAQDPSEYKEYCFTLGERPAKGALWSLANPDGWRIETTWEIGDHMCYVWARPEPSVHGYKNVAVAASITGAARSDLLRGLSLAVDPVYCDTDSIICQGFSGNIDPKTLGGWKHEASGNKIAIGGKKMYALFDGEVCVKKASKGGKLRPDQIIEVAIGNVVEYPNPVPKFKLNGDQVYTTRHMRNTANGLQVFGV